MTADEIRAKALAAIAPATVTGAAAEAADAAMAAAASQAINPGTEIQIAPEEAPVSDEAKAALQGNEHMLAQQVALLQDQLARALEALATANLQLPQTVAAEPVLKRYHSVLPFINVPIMRRPGYCENVTFIGGILETKDPAVQAVIEAAIDAGGSGFSMDRNFKVGHDEELRANDMAEIAGRTHARMLGAGEKTA